MSLTRQRPPGVGPSNGQETTSWVPGRPLWQQFLIGAVSVLLVVGAILLVVRVWAVPALQARGSDSGIAGEATLAALQTQQAIAPRPIATSGVAVVVEATPVPTSAPTAAAKPAVVSQPTPQTTGAPAAQATVAPSGNSAGVAVGTEVPSLNGTPYPLPTPSPEMAKAVSDAYLRYWSVRGDALLSLDPSGLVETAAGDELAALEKNIESDRAQGRALKTDVQHQLSVLTVIDGQAVVTDHFRDSSIYLDPATHAPLPGQVAPSSPDKAPEIGVLYKLKLINGAWKVVQGQTVS